MVLWSGFLGLGFKELRFLALEFSGFRYRVRFSGLGFLGLGCLRFLSGFEG